MNQTVIINGQIIFPDEIKQGSLRISEGKIVEILIDKEPDLTDVQVVDAQGKYISPGFIELHSHGGGGADFMDGTSDAFEAACSIHLAHGTTTMYPTTLSAGMDEMYQAVDSFRVARKNLEGKQFLPGLHFEGPYFHMKQRGAQDPRYIKDPDREEYLKLIEYAKGDIARWSVAPELDGALEMGDELFAQGILASIGHSNAEYTHCKEAYQHHYTHITHLYSGMSSIVRRSGFRHLGVIESAYAIEEFTVEVIADGCHIPPELLRMVYRLKGADRTCLITDSLRCTGQNVTESLSGSEENGQRIIIEDGVAKMPDRSAFAGSVATADRLIRTAYHIAEIPLVDAVKMMSLTPARVMGIDKDCGSIAVGKWADLLIFDDDIQIERILFQGKQV